MQNKFLMANVNKRNIKRELQLNPMSLEIIAARGNEDEESFVKEKRYNRASRSN